VDPRVVSQAVADLVFAVGVDDQCAHATAFAAGERSGEEQEALVCEVVHERGVIGHGGLVSDPAVGPARACFADNGVGAQRARAIRERYVFWRR
jgi:hypothetical protein